MSEWLSGWKSGVEPDIRPESGNFDDGISVADHVAIASVRAVSIPYVDDVRSYLGLPLDESKPTFAANELVSITKSRAPLIIVFIDEFTVAECCISVTTSAGEVWRRLTVLQKITVLIMFTSKFNQCFTV